MPFSLADYAMGNAVLGGASSVQGVLPDFSSRIEQMVAAMPPEIRGRFRIISGFRSPERQAQVNPAVKNSRHSHGMALDLNSDPEVLSWINQHGSRFGVGFPLSSDPRERNHLEMLTSAGGRAPIGYIPTGDSQFKSGLASATPQAEAPSVPYDPPQEPASEDTRKALAILALSNLGGGGFGSQLSSLGSGLGDALTRGLAPVQPTPASIIPNEQQLVGNPLPLARRIS